MLPQDATGLPASSPCPTHKAPPISSELNHQNPSVPPLLGPSYRHKYIARVMTAFCVWKVIDIGEDTIKIIKSALAAIAHSQHMIHSPCSCGPLMHPASQKTHPITRGLPSLDLISFDTLQHDTAPWCRYVPIECQNNFTQNSMNLADLRRMMRIYFLLRQKSRQNARKNLSSPFLGCKRPFAFKSEQVKQACNKALYQNI